MNLTSADPNISEQPARRARRPAKQQPGVDVSASSISSSPLAAPAVTTGVATITHLTEKLAEYMNEADLKKVKEAYR